MSQILRHHLTKEYRDERFFSCLIWIKGPYVQKFEGPTHSKILGIFQTELYINELYP